MPGITGLEGKTILFLTVDGFASQYFHPLVTCLRETGATVLIASYNSGDHLVARDAPLRLVSDISFSQAAQREFDAVIIADNVTGDAIRENLAVMRLVERTWARGNALLVTVDRGAAALIGAGLVDNRVIAAGPELRDQLRDAGAKAAKTPIAISENIITAAPDAHLDVLCQDIISHLQQGWAAAA